MLKREEENRREKGMGRKKKGETEAEKAMQTGEEKERGRMYSRSGRKEDQKEKE